MIFVECDNDEALLRGLGIPRAKFDHHAGKPRVAKALQTTTSTGSIGIVDQDPGAIPPPYLTEFRVADDQPSLGLRRLKHRKDDKWLIEIQPDLEPWIYQMAKAASIAPIDNHLPERHSVLHDYPKTYEKRLVTFISTLHSQGNPRLATLARWLSA